MKKALIVGLVLAFTAGICLAANSLSEAPAKQTKIDDSKVVPASQVPYVHKTPKAWYLIHSQDFETSMAPWTHTNGQAFPAGWDRQSSALHATWTPPSAGSWSLWIDSDAAGSGVIINDTTISPVVATTGYNQAWIKWGMSFNWYSYSLSEEVIMMYRINNGGVWGSWANGMVYSGADYSARWDSVNVAALGDSIQIGFFYGPADYEYYAVIDNVTITAEMLLNHNLALGSIDQPAIYAEPGTPFTPTVTVSNVGLSPESDFQVIYQINDGAKALVYQDTVQVVTPDTVQVGNDLQLSGFDDFTPIDLTNYNVTAWVELAGDLLPSDDTLTMYFRTFNELVGNVTDDNNGGAPLAGVTITATGPDTAVTTTDGDGDYFFFDLTAGTYDVTAELAGYVDETATGVTITDFAQTTMDLSMGYPVLALSPTDSVYVSLPWGGADSTTWQFTVENTGTRDMTYNVYWPESTLTKGSKDPVTLVLDDGTRDNDIGIGGASEMIWVNRFTPDPSQYPFMLNQVQFYFSAQGNVAVGHGLVIVVYENTTGGSDPAVGSNLLYQYTTTVQALDAWNVYDLPEPVLFNGPGDVVIGAINTYLPGSSYWPASLDQTATQQRSWAGAWSTATHPEPPTLPPDDLWTLIDAYFPGNWMVRGYGETGGGNAVWLNITPASGTVSAYGTENLAVAFNAAGLDSFTDWAANVRFHTNAAADQFVPAWMHVLGLTGVSGGPTQPLSYAFGLNANRPNPANGRTTFSFTLPKSQDYALRVYNIAGQAVATFTGRGQAGPNSVAWNTGKNGAGVYFYQLVSGGMSATRKLVVVK